MATTASLHSGPPAPATLFRRVQGVLTAAFLLSMLYLFGFPGAILTQIRTAVQGKPWALLNPLAWRNAVVANGLPAILNRADKTAAPIKRAAVFPYARGRVLEVGAGTGMTVKYYDAGKITELYLVEPFAELHPALRKTIAATPGLEGKTTIIPFGIENRAKLEAAGISPGSFDTISLIQVLCSIPEPEKHVKYLQSLLKPGGQLLLFEHVASEDKLTNALQSMYNPIWTFLSGGCNVNRNSATTVASLGGWQSVTVQRSKEEHNGMLYPHVVGQFVKV